MGHPLRAPAAPNQLTRDIGRQRLDRLELTLGHRFTRPALLREAVTHPSALGRTGARQRGKRSYERLEFLGDRVVGLIVVDMLIRRFPGEPEGALTKRLGALVNRDALAEVARGIDLGSCIEVAPSENEGRDKPGLLADACEAVIGAIYLDGGIEPARRFIENRWAERLEAAASPPRDAKMDLQEWAQARAMGLPGYRVLETSGPAHAPRFKVEVTLEGLTPRSGEGPSKREAERAAASALLQVLGGGVRG